MVDLSRCANSAAEVDAFHPGMLIDPVSVAMSPQERLAHAETLLLDWAISKALRGESEARGLALSIIVLRAARNT